MSSPQFTVTLDGSGKIPQEFFPRMVADGPRQALSLQDRLGSKNGSKGKRGRQDNDTSASDERRHSTGSLGGGGRKRARLDGADLRHRLSGPPDLPTETADLRQRLTSQDSGTFLRPSNPVIRPASSLRQVRNASDSQPGPIRKTVYVAPRGGSTDLRSKLNSVTPLPTAIASSVPSSAPKQLPATVAQSTVTDVRSKPALAPARTRPVTVTRAPAAAPALSHVRPVGAPQGKLRSEVVLPSGAVSAVGGVKKVASVVKRTISEPVAAVPVSQVAAPATAPKTVKGLLISLGLEKYLDVFVREEVDMMALKHMEDSDLKELGIPMGPRKKIVQALMR